MRLNFLTGIQCCGSTIGIHSFNCGFVQTWVQKCYNGAEKPEAVIIGSRVCNREHSVVRCLFSRSGLLHFKAKALFQ